MADSLKKKVADSPKKGPIPRNPQEESARGIGHLKIAIFSRLSGSILFLCLLQEFKFLQNSCMGK